jgi:lysophospholipase L1-like esterase
LVVAALVGLTVAGSAGSAGSAQQSGPRALFFGDSLLAGTGALPPRPVEARTAADRLGWRAVVDARGGTGYTTGGRHGRPYLTRLRTDGFLTMAYDVIVLEGGTNDAAHGSLTRLRSDALGTVDYVHRRQPHARLVLVGAYAPYGIALDRYQAVDQILAGVAHDRGLLYISQFEYSAVSDPGFLSRDHYHPSDEGYGVMGRALAESLRQS